MTAFKEFFVAERAKALAQIHVTRRDDLRIRKFSKGDPFAYFLDIRSENAPVPCRVGLAIEAAMSFESEGRTSAEIEKITGRIGKCGPLSYPVVLFYFTVKDDRGYYAWIWKPEVDESGNPKLGFQPAPQLSPLNDESLEQIVESAKGWYEAVHLSLTR